jgi:hypothetical protein
MAEHAFSIDWVILIDLHTLYGCCPIVCLCERILSLIRFFFFFVMFQTFRIYLYTITLKVDFKAIIIRCNLNY